MSVSETKLRNEKFSSLEKKVISLNSATMTLLLLSLKNYFLQN